MALDFITLQKELNLIKDKLQNNFRIITENKGLIESDYSKFIFCTSFHILYYRNRFLL